MDLTLVPFGFSVAEQKLVDVHEVQSGRQCGCICPACQAPLIARKGSKKVWHFAHDSRSDLVGHLEKCSYSFFVSARMMARQLIGDQLEMALPRFDIQLFGEDPHTGEPIYVTEPVAKPRQVQLRDVLVDVDVDGQRYDILGYVEGHALAFVFTHPGRESFHLLKNSPNKKPGIVEIALDGLKIEFRRHQSPDRSYGDILADYMSNDTRFKNWLHHPRREFAEEKARSRLAAALLESKRARGSRGRQVYGRKSFDDDIFTGLDSVRRDATAGKKFEYVCRLCNSSWRGVGNADASCKKCGNALLVSRIELDG